MGEVWKVLTDGGAWAVKALFPWAVSEPLPRDVDVQLAALESGIALPRPVVHHGSAVVTVESRQYRAYEWVELAPPVQPPAPAAVAHEAGSILGRVHTLPITVDGDVDDWYTTTPDPSTLAELADAARSADAWWGAVLGSSLPLVAGLRDLVAIDHSPPGLCHRDFDVSNVVPATGSNALVTLDWENVGPLPQDQELASALLAWCTSSGAAEPRAIDAFLDGYRAAGGSVVVRPESFSMAVCTSLNFLRVMAEQSLDRDEHLDYADARLEELLLSSLPNLLASIRQVTARIA